MAKRIQVGGRIESKEVGGIVTGAAEILDDAKGKKQSVINGETDDELLRLDQSKQDNLTFDNAPTEGSDNPVKSGGLYTAQQAILLAIVAINELIPSAASALNQLADKAFVNSSISTNTATFRGTSAAGLNEQQFLAWANGLEHDLNDYVFWQTSDAAGNTLFKRYKWNGTEWRYEYTLNNSTFTAEQWEAIQSGITALLVTKLRALPTAQELIQSFDSKQNVLTFDDVPTLGSTNPVKSSGIYNVIKAITDLIPAEATAQNQLADKADVAAKIVAAIPSWKGQYDALTDLQAVTGAKAGDMGCVKTTDSDGHAVLTFYQYSAQGAWVVYYTLQHYARNKPATTGTTGDYPHNGMGRIELQKNIVNGVNTLTQAMLTQQNTIYVIQYDFTLGEDITIPANCVLEFDGGSISGDGTGKDTIIGQNSDIVSLVKKIFNNINFTGTWITKSLYVEYFISTFGSDCSDVLNTIIQAVPLECELCCNHNLIISNPVNITKNIDIHFKGDITLNNNGSFVLNGISYRTLRFNKIIGDGYNGNTRGLMLQNASFNNVEFVAIRKCKYGISFNESNISKASIGQNIFKYTLIYECTIGIYFKGGEGTITWGENGNVAWAEGNEFFGGFIAKCYNSGIYLDDNIKCGNSIFIGPVDCVEADESAYDIIDNTNTISYSQKNIYINNYLRPAKVQMREQDTIIATEYGIQSYGTISSHDGVSVANENNSSFVAAGSIEIANSVGGYIDLKNDKSEDRDIRLMSDGNNFKISSGMQDGTVKVSVGNNASIESEAAAGKVLLKENSLRGTDAGLSSRPSTGNRGFVSSNNVFQVPNAGNTSVTQGDSTKTVNFSFKPATNDYVLFVTPSWKTLYNITSRSVNGFVVSFDTPAPDNASFDWIMMGKGML